MLLDDFDLQTGQEHDFVLSTNTTPNGIGHPISLAYTVLIICQTGNAVIDINFNRYTLKPFDIMVLAEDSISILQSRTEDFSWSYYLMNRQFAAEVAYQLPNALFAYLNKVPHFSPKNDQQTLLATCQQETNFIWQKCTQYKRLMLCNHLQNFFLAMTELVTQMDNIPKNKYSRKEKTCWQFWELIGQHSKKEREVAFYANKLHITPYYLAQLSKQFFNDAPKTLIDRQVILNIKQLLKQNNLSIQNIADQMSFNDASYMCRYFKKHTGYSLSQYRHNR